MSIYQIICNSKADFPLKGENLLVGENTFIVLKTKIALRIPRLNLYFVNVVVQTEGK